MSSPAIAFPAKSPDAFRTISEVAAELELPQHVLRFWESRFPQIKPVKRAGGRRYYRPEDVDLLRGIAKLLHVDGLTIRGAQKVLKERGLRHVAQIGRGGVAEPIAAPVIVEKVVFVERPAQTKATAAAKKRPAHLRAVPNPMTLPLFDEPQAAPDTASQALAREERAKLQALLGGLNQLKTRLAKARERAAI